MAAMIALETILKVKSHELENDVWMMYIGMPCPNPEVHQLTGFCPDCDNKSIELGDKDVASLCALMRLALANKRLYQCVRQ